MKKFFLEPSGKIVFGVGSVREYLACLARMYGPNTLLVSGVRSAKENGAYDDVLRGLRAAGKQVVELSGIPGDTRTNSVTRQQRAALAQLLKHFPVSLSGPRPIAEAIVTSGGVATTEVNPRTMESKLVPGLYFAGEVLDLDAYTGGYNLQIAWSTAFVAANSLTGV